MRKILNATHHVAVFLMEEGQRHFEITVLVAFAAVLTGIVLTA